MSRHFSFFRNTLAALMETAQRKRQSLDIFVSLVGINLLLSGFAFITTILIANLIGKEGFGDLSFAIAVGTYGLVFVQYGLDKSLVRELVHYPTRCGELFKASLLVRGILFIVFCGLLLIGIAIFHSRGGFTWGMVPIILATAINAFQLHGVYDAWQEMARHASYLMVERGSYLLLICIALLLAPRKLSLGLIGLLLIVAVLLGLFFQYRWALRRMDFRPVQGIWASTGFMLRSNAFIWLAVLSGLSIDYLSQIILKMYCGSAELGMYSVAWRIGSFSTLFLVQAGRLGAEATARYTRPENTSRARIRFMAAYMGYMTGIGFVVGLPCFLVPQYILLVFRSEYASAVETMRLFGFYPLLFGPYLAVLQYIISIRMQKLYFVLISISGLISIALNLWLIPLLQSKGAAIAVNLSLGSALLLFGSAVFFHLKRGKLVESEDALAASEPGFQASK